MRREMISENNRYIHLLREIATGKRVWEEISFKERTMQGWLNYYLLELDKFYIKRWHYWLEAISTRKLKEIPKIFFLDSANPEAKTMLEKCIYHNINFGIKDFLRWLLWGFGVPDHDKHPVDMGYCNEKTNEYWYRNFNLGLLMESPFDYWGDLYAESKGVWNKTGFFATPHPVCRAMVEMTMKRADITSSVLEPALGTGRMLLEASNYSLNLFGIDIDPICLYASKVNAFCYVPWIIAPDHKLMEEGRKPLERLVINEEKKIERIRIDEESN